MKKVKEYGALVLITLICICLVGGSVLAEERASSRSSHITSRGVLDYENGKVVIDSSDLIYLANQIDALETAYKSATVDALNQISTFYSSADGDISHDYQENIVSSDSASVLSFNDLYQGILKSQSVEHLKDVQAKDSDGSLLYYADLDASDNNNLTRSTTETTDFPIMTQSAIENNLTAGTAAWVDGKLIIGNGADNQTYYNLGYADGLADNVPGDAKIEYVRHKHTDECYEDLTCNYTWKKTREYHKWCAGCQSDMPHDDEDNRALFYSYSATHSVCDTTSTKDVCQRHNSSSNPSGTQSHIVNVCTCGYREGEIVSVTITWH